MQHTCKKCTETKHLIDFPVNYQMILGVRNECKECTIKIKKEWNFNNKEKLKQYSSEYQIKNRLEIKIKNKIFRTENKENIKKNGIIYRQKNLEKLRIKNQKYKKENNDKIKESKKIKYKEKMLFDPVFLCKERIRGLIIISVKKQGYTKKSKTFEILGCEYDFFKNYIEAQFKKGMQWDNIHLDHIKPISIAKTEKEVIELNHYTNFQPLFAKDNLQKGTNLITKQLRLI